jgi:hypothetical protein
MSSIASLAPGPASRTFKPAAIMSETQSASPVWVVSIGSALALVALFLAHQGTLLRAAVPMVAAAVALTLYLRRPVAYFHFTLWTWFLTPLLRRIIDWRFGFQDQNLVLLAPFLVTAVAAITVVREFRQAPRSQLAPYLLCCAGIFYGFSVGLIRWFLHNSEAESVGSIVYGLFLWLAPLLFGMHLCLRWQSYEAHRSAILASFKWGVLLLGAYGIYQYVAPPAWDTAWLEGLPGRWETQSFGRPFPYEIRVWSTLNSPGTFAAMMFPGLILLLVTKTRMKALIAAAGFGAFLLSLVRTGWLAWVLAILLLAISQRSGVIRRVSLIILLLPVGLIPILLVPKFQQTIEDRMATMTDLNHDGSLNDREMMYKRVTAEMLSNPSGVGLLNGSTFSVDAMPLDSGFIQTALMLGFVGTAFYASGIVVCLAGMVRRRNLSAGPADEFAGASSVIFVVMLFELVGSNVFVNFFGFTLWIFYGLWSASKMHAKRAGARPHDALFAPHARVVDSTLALPGQLCDEL